MDNIIVNMTTIFNGTDNKTIEELLLLRLGPRRHDLPVVVILLTIYCVIFISGTVGNICTCVVIVKNSYMQTTTNYYLFSLAISDMLTLIFGKFFYILYKLYLMVIHLHLLNQIQIFLLILEYSETG
jgi:hypothetical protein